MLNKNLMLRTEQKKAEVFVLSQVNLSVQQHDLKKEAKKPNKITKVASIFKRGSHTRGSYILSNIFAVMDVNVIFT